MANIYTAGTFTPPGWSVGGPVTPWSTSALASANNKGGFSFSYDGTPTPVKPRKSYPLPTDLAANVALTYYTDTLQGGYSVNPATQLYLGPLVGVNLGRQTVLDLGPALAATGNSLSGYGDTSGVQLGTQQLFEDLYINSYASGVILGSSASDNIYGQSYGIASGAIENYGVILLAGGSDSINGNATTLAFGGYGLINWGLIDTGGENRKDANDSISGIGNTIGIQNSTLTVETASVPKISTGAGADVITGQAEEDNFGILNDGLIDMGTGNDRYQSLVNDQQALTSYFGGDGVVAMGRGNDIVQGFGSGTYYGDAVGEVVQSKIARKILRNYDSLYLIDDKVYTVTAITAEGNHGQTINGFSITDGDATMSVFSFETIGTSAANQVTLQAGVYDFTNSVPT